MTIQQTPENYDLLGPNVNKTSPGSEEDRIQDVKDAFVSGSDY